MPAIPRLTPLLLLLACEGPNEDCPGLFRSCGYRFVDAETCGTTERLPVRPGDTFTQIYLHWQDPDGACWPGQTGSPPLGWSISEEPWCNDSLKFDPGICPGEIGGPEE